MHWTLLIVCYPGLAPHEQDVCKFPCLVLLDSMGGRKSKVFRAIRAFLKDEWMHRRPATILERDFSATGLPGCNPKVPNQTNSCDCGVFVLQYAEEFLKEPFKDVRKQQLNRSDWFPRSSILRKRVELRRTILDLREHMAAVRSGSSGASRAGGEDGTVSDDQDVEEHTKTEGKEKSGIVGKDHPRPKRRHDGSPPRQVQNKNQRLQRFDDENQRSSKPAVICIGTDEQCKEEPELEPNQGNEARSCAELVEVEVQLVSEDSAVEDRSTSLLLSEGKTLELDIQTNDQEHMDEGKGTGLPMMNKRNGRLRGSATRAKSLLALHMIHETHDSD